MVITQSLRHRRRTHLRAQPARIRSRCISIPGQVVARSPGSASSGNHPPTCAAHPVWVIAPRRESVTRRSSARDTSRSSCRRCPPSASWRWDRPAYQWVNNSIRSNTSKLLLAIGALPHESIRESSEPVCEAHNRLPHHPGWRNYGPLTYWADHAWRRALYRGITTGVRATRRGSERAQLRQAVAAVGTQ